MMNKDDYVINTVPTAWNVSVSGGNPIMRGMMMM